MSTQRTLSTLTFALLCALGHAAQPTSGSAKVANSKAEDTAVADKAAFSTCAACHSVDGSAKAMGPTLKGVVGRKAASDAGYKRFSKALTASAITWNSTELDAYLKAPNTRVKGTTMMVSVVDAKKRAAIVRYLSTLK
jgi:cytochrome c